jgi:hypothetical protein
MKKEVIQQQLIRIAFVPFVYALIMTIMSSIVFLNPKNFRLSNTNPATLTWFSMMLLLDSIHLILCTALYRGNLKSQNWIVGGIPMTFIQILKILLYFLSFGFLIANPVADLIGAMSALIAALALISFLVTRYFYLKNYNLDERVSLFLNDEYNSGLNH